ncbi:hypothetical protein ANN_25285 [Periplaneta americana]|uniref:Uncharacterized protein n=1 Tax=Periplaneta americana TaxID=6978 RepID=A0ABQ8S160_PERAM|nr:hypothetical protein ANN_25285 [Periplaneta americana]
MAGLFEGGNEPPGSLKAILQMRMKNDSIITNGVEIRKGKYLANCFMDLFSTRGHILTGLTDNSNMRYKSEEKDDYLKDSFYEELEQTFDQLPRYHMKILLGDFNAKVGREDIFKSTIGKESIRNDNEVSICFFERIPNLSAEQSDGITVYRISPMPSLILHRCRTERDGSKEISQNYASVAQKTTYTVAMTAIEPSSCFVPISLQRDVFVVHRSGEIRNTLFVC